MKSRVKKIIFDNFKGIRHAEYTFDSDRIEIDGRNGSGKSTIMCGHHWIWADKDENLNANPEVHNLNMEVSEPTVTEIAEIDGKEVEIKKVQQDGRTKKQIENGDPIKVKNVYYVNSVPKSQRDFIKDMEDRGVAMDDFELLSHTDEYTSRKTADCRKILFAMSSSQSDKDIADSMPDCKELAERLESRTLEEIEAEMKASKKRLSSRLDSIPSEIIGLESAIVEIDTKKLEQRKSELSLKLTDITNKIAELSSETKSAINSKITELTAKQKALESEINAERDKNIRDRRTAMEDAQREYKFAASKTADLESSLELTNKLFRSAVREFEQLGIEYDDIDQKVYKADRLVCESCGQILPPNMVEEAKQNWEKRKSERLSDIHKKMEFCGDHIKEAKASMESIGKKLDESRSNESELSRKYDILKNELEFAEATPTGSVWDNEDYKELNVEIETLKASLANADSIEQWRADLTRRSIEIKEAIYEIDMTIAKEEVNVRTRGEIQKLRDEQREAGQLLSDCEKILYQIQTLNMEKNSRLENSVNAHFPDFIKFRLFKTLKNGETKDDCEPYVRDENGEWKSFSQASNAGLQTLAKLGILQGVQNFYEQSLPIFLDNAESLDSESRKRITNDTQVILLSVTDDDLSVKTIS